jgi:hypothetical protein
VAWVAAASRILEETANAPIVIRDNFAIVGPEAFLI